jgi:putative transposase
MPTPRRNLIDRTESGYYHCINRCVRRAFLCGDDYEHRREWIEDRARELASIFAIDVCKFGVLSNHYHAILRNEPDAAAEWSRDEVKMRWKRLFPKTSLVATSGGADDGEERVRVLRKRLCDLSWFMRCLNEYIARRANREDDCKGRFWEGRFKSIRLVDEAALLACSIYIDLNPLRAGLAETPEESIHTSVHNRILVKQFHESRRGERPKAPKGAEKLIAHPGEVEQARRTSSKKKRGAKGNAPFRADEAGIWMPPVEIAPHGGKKTKSAAARRRRGLFNMTLNTYLELVDTFGRIVKTSGACIAEHQRPILARLRVDPDKLSTFLASAGRFYGTIAGAKDKVKKEAQRRKRTRAVRIFDIGTAD